jgi:hypothetical protein
VDKKTALEKGSYWGGWLIVKNRRNVAYLLGLESPEN